MGTVATLAALLVALAVLALSWPWAGRQALPAHLARARRAVRLAQRPRWAAALLARLGVAGADRLCQHAGRPWGLTGERLLYLQALCGLVWMAAGGAALGPGYGLALGALAGWVPRVYLSALAQQRRQRIALELPSFLDLWALLLTAGEGLEAALVEVCRSHPDWLLSAEMRRVLDRVFASGLFGDSLVEEARVTGSPDLLLVAEQVRHLASGGGVPSRELTLLADRLREQRAAAMAQAANNLAVAGVFPKLGAVVLSLAPVVATVILTALAAV